MDRDTIRHALTGPFPSLRTPFFPDGAIDFDGLRTTIDFCIDAGSRTLMLTYGDSLYTLLTDDEIAEVTKVTVQHTAGRAMVIAADRQWATPKEVAFAQYCREVGADLLMVFPPDWGGSCTANSLVEHYAAVAEEIPVMLITCAFSLRDDAFGLEVMGACRDHIPQVVAVKDDVCGAFARQVTSRFGDQWAVISGGQKQNHMDLMPYGCVGYLSTFMTFAPRVAHEYWESIQNNRLDAAMKIIREVDMPLFDYLLKLEGCFDAGMHGLSEIVGHHGRWRRRPYHSLTDAQMDDLRLMMQSLKVI